MAAKQREFTPSELGLLDAIHSDPRNDQLRMVYADWLEDQGRSGWARLVREQIASAKDTTLQPSVRHQASWARPLPRTLQFVYISRGLPVAQPRTAGMPFDDVASALRGACPRLRLCFHLRDDDMLPAALAHPVMDRCSIVFLHQPTRFESGGPPPRIRASAIAALAASGLPGRLDRIVTNYMTDEALDLCRMVLEPQVRVRTLRN
jgi:uncharacterized protein (TIGR02996 family)